MIDREAAMSQPMRVPRSNRDLQANGQTNRDGPLLVAADLSFQVQPGKVTGFLGPNGPGSHLDADGPGLGRCHRRQALVNGRP